MNARQVYEYSRYIWKTYHDERNAGIIHMLTMSCGEDIFQKQEDDIAWAYEMTDDDARKAIGYYEDLITSERSKYQPSYQWIDTYTIRVLGLYMFLDECRNR